VGSSEKTVGLNEIVGFRSWNWAEIRATGYFSTGGDNVGRLKMTGDAQSGAVYLKASATLVSMQQEMYKDALFFLSEAKNCIATKQDIPFGIWRFFRAVILFSFAATEATINHFISAHIDRHRNELPQAEIDKWTEKKKYMSMTNKLREGIQWFGNDRFDERSQLWRDFLELKEWRDALVHFRDFGRANTSIAYLSPEESLKTAEKAIRTASMMIKKIYVAHPDNRATYPSTFDEMPG